MKKNLKGNILLSLSIITLAAFAVTGCGSKSTDTTATTAVPETTSTETVAADTTTSESTEVTTEVATIPTGGDFTYGLATEIDNFDPFDSLTADTRKILFNIFEGLVKPTTDGGFIPAVAESYTISDDALTYTFILRDGIKFQNGADVTTDDVLYSIQKAIDASISGYDNIAKFEATDDKTIVITLTNADTDFLPYLTTAIVPKDYADQKTAPIGTGPFAFDSYESQQYITLKKNEYYWQEGSPYLDTVTFKFAADSTALLLELQAGGVDAIGIDNAGSKQVHTSLYNIVEQHSNAVQLLALNNASGPFKDEKVRQALSYAIDPQEIIDIINDGIGTRVGSGLIPGLTKYYDASLVDTYNVDLDKAKSLLADAGYPDGFEFTITVPSVYQVHVDTAQVIVNQLAKIGVTANIELVDWSTWLTNVYTNRDYEATIISLDGANVSPKSFLSRYESTADNNFVNFSNSDYDTVYQEAVAETDETKRIELYKQAQKLLADNAASVYIQDISNLVTISKKFDGLVEYPLYVFDASTIHLAATPAE